MVENIRAEIIRLGGEIRFECKVIDIDIQHDQDVLAAIQFGHLESELGDQLQFVGRAQV